MQMKNKTLLKTLLGSLSVLSLSLVVGCSQGGNNSVDNPGTPSPSAGNSAAPTGTKALQMKTGEEYYETLKVLTGVDMPDGDTRDVYENNVGGFPLTNDPLSFNSGHAKEIISLAAAFCSNDVIENDDRRRALFPQGTVFDSEDIPANSNLASPIIIEMIVTAFTDAYWVGSQTLVRSGDDLPFGTTSRQDLRLAATELASQGSSMEDVLTAVCTLTLSSGSVLFH